MAKRTTTTIRPTRDVDEMLAYAAVASEAFSAPVLQERDWLERYDRSWFRVAVRNRQIVAGLVILPMGQWFGGRSVPTIGIHAVGVAADHRGRGVGTALMRSALQEAHRDGIAISSLYPATQPIYRSVGYEQAGSWNTYRTPMWAIACRDREPPIERVAPADVRLLHAAYEDHASASAGHLDRTDWCWRRLVEPAQGESQTYRVVESGKTTGYAITSHRGIQGSQQYDLLVRDAVATTEAAARRLLTFFADHRQIGRDILWHGGVVESFHLLLQEQSFAAGESLRWMIRIVDLPTALAARGFPAMVQGELHLQVTDDLFAANNDRFVLEVADGEGRLRRGGQGRLRIDIRGLAALYSGYSTATALATAGYLEGPRADQAMATALFAGPAPWMAETF